MTCYFPLAAYRDNKGHIVFNPKQARRPGSAFYVSCGQCIGCKLDYAKQWAIRIQSEAFYYDNNVFVTLTYDKDNLPQYGSLNPRDLTLFIKRLRKKKSRYNRYIYIDKKGREKIKKKVIDETKIKYYAAGEYGEKNLRPHFHIIIFNCWFDDYRLYDDTCGYIMYESDELVDCWKKGQCTFSRVVFESASYVAQYTLKSLGMDLMDMCVYDFRTGLIEHEKMRPFVRMSQGIGERYFYDNVSDIVRGNHFVRNGYAMAAPRRYVQLLKRDYPLDYAMYMCNHMCKVESNMSYFDRKRLAVKAQRKEAELKRKRSKK